MDVLRRLSSASAKDQVPRIGAIALAAALTFSCIGAAAQAKRGTTARVEPPFATAPLDESANNLPANYKGHNCAAIGARLKQIVPKKSEFETTPDYEARVTKALDAPLASGLKVGDTLAFMVDDLAISMRYDADSGTAALGMSLPGMLATSVVTLGLPPGTLALKVQTLSESRRDFVGQTALGARVQAEAVKRTICGIATLNANGSRLEVLSSATAKLPPAAAQSAKEHLGTLLVGKLAAPFHADAFRARGARIDSPVELSEEGLALALEVADVWYFNRRTGEVIAKAVAARRDPPAPPAEPKPTN